MRTFDFAPLYRSTVGFDRMFSMFDELGVEGSVPSYPPYNIERTVRTPIASRSQSPALPTLISRSRRRRIGWRSAARSRRREDRRGALPGYRRANVRA